jgi:cytochrome P450
MQMNLFCVIQLIVRNYITGTMFTYNIHKFHMDPDHWESPEVFNPDRFLQNDTNEQFIPFGFGKRMCMGESLAKSELFIFAVLLLQG